MCTEGMVPMAIVVLAVVATSPAAPRQQITNHTTGSARVP